MVKIKSCPKCRLTINKEVFNPRVHYIFPIKAVRLCPRCGFDFTKYIYIDHRKMNPADATKETIAAYEKTADEYAKSHADIEDIDHILEFFVDELKGPKVLDIGMGPGLTTEFFVEHGLTVTGVDLTDKFLKMARKNAPKANILKMDMRKLTFRANHFNGLFVCASFLHIPKNEALTTLKGFHHVLKKGGLIYIAVKEGAKEGFVDRVRYGGKRKYFTLWQKKELTDLMKHAGFIIKSAYTEKFKKKGVNWINIFAAKK